MSKLAKDRNAAPIQVLRPSSTETVSVSGTAAASSARTEDTRVLRIVCDANVFYSVDGTATTSDVYLPANTVEFIHVFDDDVVSIITSGATGTAYVTSMI